MQRISLRPVDNHQDSPRTVDGAAIVSRRNVGALLSCEASDAQVEDGSHTHDRPGTGS